MRICLVQLDVSLAEPLAERVERATAAIRGCAGADLVVLPELWAHGAWAYRDWDAVAEPIDGPTTTALAQAAKDAGVMLHGGSILERDGDRLYNTAVLIGADGDLRATYRKIHRFGFDAGEAVLLEAGDAFLTLTGGPLPMGVATCYDLRFPELFRSLVEAGAGMFVVSASWPARRREHWTLLARARAVENLAYVVAVGACGTQAGVEQAGHSLVVDPWGEIVAEADDSPGVLEVEIDVDRVAQIRAEFPALRDRRL
ncbi:MAG: carbon-nitrogen family hydrolase [Sporichthyaceae bacterium]